MLIGSIIDVFLAGYTLLTGIFYWNSNKIRPKSNPTNINLVKFIKLDQEIIRNFDFFHPFNLAYSKVTIQTYCVQAVCYTFQSHLAKISPNSTKSYQVSWHNRYILLQLGNFYQNFDKK